VTVDSGLVAGDNDRVETFRFLQFEVYQDSKSLHKELVGVVRDFPHTYRSLKDQLLRAALSILLNIAEGSAKASDKDFNRYLRNALGSTNEVFACLDIAHGVGLIKEEDFKRLSSEVESIAKQLGGFSKKLKSPTRTSN